MDYQCSTITSEISTSFPILFVIYGVRTTLNTVHLELFDTRILLSYSRNPSEIL